MATMSVAARPDCRLNAMIKALFAIAFLGALVSVVLPLSAADAGKGQAAFDNCAVCHNADSTDTKVGPGLKNLFKREKLLNAKPVNEANVLEIIEMGGSTMPAMGGVLTGEDKENLIAYLKTL